MAKISLITGGAYSGKSRWAAKYFSGCDDVQYLCTEEAISESVLNRIKFSNNENLVDWNIVTNIKKPSAMILGNKFYILDSLCSYTWNVINELCQNESEIDSKLRKKIEKLVIDEVMLILDKIRENDANIVIMTDDVGFCPAMIDPKLEIFREILGIVNQRTANMVPEVYVSISGIQIKIKG